MLRAPSLAVSLLVFSAFAAAAATASPASQGLAQGSAFQLLPGVVVDAERPAVYLMNPEQGIDAVDAASGQLLWTSQAAAKPLQVHGDLLIAQVEPTGSGVLGIVLLDRGDGKVRSTVDVTLPRGIWGSVGDRLGSSFQVWASAEGGRLLIGWENVRRRVSPIPPKRGEKLRSLETGGASIDLNTKVASALTTPPSRPERPIARLAADHGVPDKRLAAGSVQAELRTTGAAGQERLVLKRWEAATGAPLADVTLTDSAYHLRVPSVDGRNLLVSRESDAGTGDGYAFELFSLETGELLGTMEERRSHAFGFVLGSRFVYESLPFSKRQGDALVSTPRLLRAVDLVSGSALWERPIRDTSYRGPFPR